jgi:predicted ATP-grasp superfamily ATP-dependent carboligase
MQKKQGNETKSAPPPPIAEQFCRELELVASEIEPMDVEPIEKVEVAAPVPPVAATSLKKKKKASYKSMMAGMMTSSQKDIEKEKELLRKVTGGGAFSKIEKI